MTPTTGTDVRLGFCSFVDGTFELIVQNPKNGTEVTLTGPMTYPLETVDLVLPSCVFVPAKITASPPAADGGLPGPLLQRLCDISKTDHARGCQGRQYSCDCGWDGRTMDTAEEAFAWINAQSALLAEKDALIASLRMQVKGHGATISRQSKTHSETIRQLAAKDAMVNRLDAEIERLDRLAASRADGYLDLSAQLATATERLASAEAVIAPFAELKADAHGEHRYFLQLLIWAATDDRPKPEGAKDYGAAIRAARAWLTPKDGEKQP